MAPPRALATPPLSAPDTATAPDATTAAVALITSTPNEPAEPLTSAGTPGAPRHARHRRLSTVFSWVGTIGAIVVLFAAWQLWGTGLVQHHNQQRLAGQFRALVNLNTAAVGHASRGLLPGDRNEAVPRAATVTARLQIPAIGFDQYVVEGTSTGDLEQGPGHATGTAVPGQAGNVAIAGHRSTFGAPFGRLGELRPGESVIMTTTLGQRLTYVVSAGPTFVAPGETAILDNFGDDRLTLSTSDPRYSASRRLVVVARLHEPAAVSSTGPLATHPVGGPPGRLAASDTAGWNLSHLPLVLVLVAALVLLAVLYRDGSAPPWPTRDRSRLRPPVGGWDLLPLPVPHRRPPVDALTRPCAVSGHARSWCRGSAVRSGRRCRRRARRPRPRPGR